MSGRQIILTGPEAASPQEALEWGREAGINEGTAMERARKRVETKMREAAKHGHVFSAKAFSEVLDLLEDTVSGENAVLISAQGATVVEAAEAGRAVGKVEGILKERARLRERVKERRQTLDMRSPLAKDGYLLALDDVMAMLAEPGEPQT